MEQCVARLDVAMFNAILRESADDIPTDPVSDAISDPNVLPIPPGKSSFGAGAQLKTVVTSQSECVSICKLVCMYVCIFVCLSLHICELSYLVIHS